VGERREKVGETKDEKREKVGERRIEIVFRLLYNKRYLITFRFYKKFHKWKNN
jgi:hypothetical protein